MMKFKLPERPENKDLLPFLGKRLRTGRLRKKFLKESLRYSHLLPLSIYREFLAKSLVAPLSREVWGVGWTRKLLTITPTAV